MDRRGFSGNRRNQAGIELVHPQPDRLAEPLRGLAGRRDQRDAQAIRAPESPRLADQERQDFHHGVGLAGARPARDHAEAPLCGDDRRPALARIVAPCERAREKAGPGRAAARLRRSARARRRARAGFPPAGARTSDSGAGRAGPAGRAPTAAVSFAAADQRALLERDAASVFSAGSATSSIGRSSRSSKGERGEPPQVRADVAVLHGAAGERGAEQHLGRRRHEPAERPRKSGDRARTAHRARSERSTRSLMRRALQTARAKAAAMPAVARAARSGSRCARAAAARRKRRCPLARASCP